MGDRYEYNFGLYDPKLNPTMELLKFITNGGWRLVHIAPAHDGLMFFVYERPAPDGV